MPFEFIVFMSAKRIRKHLPPSFLTVAYLLERLIEDFSYTHVSAFLGITVPLFQLYKVTWTLSSNILLWVGVTIMLLEQDICNNKINKIKEGKLVSTEFKFSEFG